MEEQFYHTVPYVRRPLIYVTPTSGYLSTENIGWRQFEQLSVIRSSISRGIRLSNIPSRQHFYSAIRMFAEYIVCRPFSCVSLSDACLAPSPSCLLLPFSIWYHAHGISFTWFLYSSTLKACLTVLWRHQWLGWQGPAPKPVCTSIGDVMKRLNPALQVPPRSISNPLTVGAIRGSKWHNVSKWFDVEPGMYTSRNKISSIVSYNIVQWCLHT